VGPSPRFIACDERAIWTLNQGDGTVTRINADNGNVVATVDVGTPGPGGDIAVGGGFVWTTAINVPLTKIDPTTNEVVLQFIGRGGDALRVGHGSVWLCSFFLQEVWRAPLPIV
jgi:DNA-binding beta-propeller fold protein YncE